MHGILQSDRAITVHIAVTDVTGTVITALFRRICHLCRIAEQTLINKSHLLADLVPFLTLPFRFVGSLFQAHVNRLVVGEGPVQDNPQIGRESVLDLPGKIDSPGTHLPDIIQLVLFNTHVAGNHKAIGEDVVANLLVSIQSEFHDSLE